MGTWSTVELNGRRTEVFDPGRRRFALIYLHDGERRSMLDEQVITPVLERLGLACLCPDGGQCWWTDRCCPDLRNNTSAEELVVQFALPFARQRWKLAERSIGLFGFGMGGQGALRIAFKYPDLFPAVAGIASEIDCHQLYGRGTSLDDMYESPEQCRQDTAIMHIHPSEQPRHIEFCCHPDDVWFRGNDRLHEKLNALGVAHQCDLTTGDGGQSWDYFQRSAAGILSRLAAALELEGRRLL